MNLIDISYLGTAISGLVAIIGLPMALFQINRLNKSINYANLLSIFNIEFELNRRKERLAKIRQKNINIINGRTETQINEDEKKVIIFSERLRREAYEDYLNVFDRLCYFILKGKFNEDDFHLEYQEMLFDTIDKDDEEMFTVTSRYRNMLKLYSLWKRK